jgi:hypothetical protein
MSSLILGMLWLLIVTGCFAGMKPQEDNNERP